MHPYSFNPHKQKASAAQVQQIPSEIGDPKYVASPSGLQMWFQQFPWLVWFRKAGFPKSSWLEHCRRPMFNQEPGQHRGCAHPCEPVCKGECFRSVCAWSQGWPFAVSTAALPVQCHSSCSQHRQFCSDASCFPAQCIKCNPITHKRHLASSLFSTNSVIVMGHPKHESACRDCNSPSSRASVGCRAQLGSPCRCAALPADVLSRWRWLGLLPFLYSSSLKRTSPSEVVSVLLSDWWVPRCAVIG